MLRRITIRFLICGLLLSLSAPSLAFRGAGALCCFEGCLLGSMCCLLTARAPHGSTVRDPSVLGTAVVTTLFLADAVLNAVTAAYDDKAREDVVTGQENAEREFKAATVMSAFSSALLFMGAVGGLPQLIGPRLAAVFALMATGVSVGGLVSSVVGYGTVQNNGGVTADQEASRDLSIVSLVANALLVFAHPVWLWWRIEHSESAA